MRCALETLLSATAVMLLSAACLADTVQEDFTNSDMENWEIESGRWKIVNGQLRQTGSGRGNYAVFSRIFLEEGTVTARIRVDSVARSGTGSIGLVFLQGDGRGATRRRVGGSRRVELTLPDGPYARPRPKEICAPGLRPDPRCSVTSTSSCTR